MRRRSAFVALLAIAALALLLSTAPRGAHADDGSVARDLLERSQAAVYDHTFDGTVTVEWIERGKQQHRTVAVHVGDGVIRMGNDRLVSAGTRRLLRTGTGWRVLWGAGTTGSEPDPTGKYRFVVTHSGSVAQRPSTQVAISRAGTSGVRERMFFDDETGMLLRRDQLDDRGRLVHRFAFVTMSTPVAVEGAGTAALPKVGATSGRNAPHALKDMPDDLQAPTRTGHGFKLSGAYSQPDGSVQLYYSDGLLALSVFEREGELDWDSLPTGGRTVELGGVKAKVYVTAAGTAVVWGSHDVTYTCVTDASLDEVAGVTADLSGSDDSSVLEDVGQFVTAPFSWS
jgi:MucB/RseB N-terminal domain